LLHKFYSANEAPNKFIPSRSSSIAVDSTVRALAVVPQQSVPPAHHHRHHQILVVGIANGQQG
jgi:hypothetical protein